MSRRYDRDYDRDRFRREEDERERWRSEGRRGEGRGSRDCAGDEMRSWFGDEEAARRRNLDDMRYGRGSSNTGSDYYGRNYNRENERDDNRSEYGRQTGRDYNQDWNRGSQDWNRSQDYGRGADWRTSDYERGQDYGRGQQDWGRHQQDWGRGQEWGRNQQDYGRGQQDYGRAQDYGRTWGVGVANWDYTRQGGQGRTWDEGRHAGRGPRNYTPSDDRITEEINQQLTHHSMIDASDIDVNVQNGEVTLSGTVEHRQMKRTAEDIAEDVWGVKEVHNKIRIKNRQDREKGQQAA